MSLEDRIRKQVDKLAEFYGLERSKVVYVPEKSDPEKGMLHFEIIENIRSSDG